MPAARRSSFLTASAGSLVIIMLLASCAANPAPEHDGAEADGDALLPVTEGTTQYPLTLETAYGESSLTQRPERIAVIGGLGDLESVLALGVTPVVGSDEISYDWLDGTTHADIDTFVSPWDESFAFEKLLETDPDLIVASTYGNLAQDYDRLTEIAPVLAIDPTGDYAWDWRELVRSVGEAVDLSARAEEEIAKTEKSVSDAEAAHPEYAGQTLAIIINRGQESGIQFVNTAKSPAEELLDGLGFAPHPEVEQLSTFEWGDVSLENIGLIDADALLVARHGGDEDVATSTAWLEGHALYQNLTAVQNGKTAYLDPNPENDQLELAWALAYPNVLANRWAVEELTTALDGLYK